MQQGMIVRAFIASPSDVGAERNKACDVVRDWNASNSLTRAAIVEAVRNETHAMSVQGAHPQDLLSKQLLPRCDFLIAIFHWKLGTPTNTDPSGTAQEIREFGESKGFDRIMLFFSTANLPHDHDPQEFARLKEFKKAVSTLGIYITFSDVNDFASKLRNQVDMAMNNLLPHQSQPQERDQEVELSQYALTILLAASCSNGKIAFVEMRGCTDFSFGEMTFEVDPSESNVWLAGVRELVDSRLASKTGPGSFSLDSSAYELADGLWNAVLLRQFTSLFGAGNMIDCDRVAREGVFGIKFEEAFLEEKLSDLSSAGFLKDHGGDLSGGFNDYQILPEANKLIRVTSNLSFADLPKSD